VIYTDGNGCWSSSDTLNVNFVGIADYEWNHDITILPNPSSGTFTVNATTVTGIDIYTSTGLLLRSMANLSTSTVKVDMTGNAPGLYLVKITTPNTAKMIRLIID
jgi:hypothetical protein